MRLDFGRGAPDASKVFDTGTAHDDSLRPLDRIDREEMPKAQGLWWTWESGA